MQRGHLSRRHHGLHEAAGQSPRLPAGDPPMPASEPPLPAPDLERIPSRSPYRVVKRNGQWVVQARHPRNEE